MMVRLLSFQNEDELNLSASTFSYVNKLASDSIDYFYGKNPDVNFKKSQSFNKYILFIGNFPFWDCKSIKKHFIKKYQLEYIPRLNNTLHGLDKKYCLIFLSVGISQSNYISICKTIRQTKINKFTPIIAVTNNQKNFETRNLCRLFDDVICRATTKENLRNQIERWSFHLNPIISQLKTFKVNNGD